MLPSCNNSVDFSFVLFLAIGGAFYEKSNTTEGIYVPDGKRLKECRIACGLSQEQLIEAVMKLPDNRGKERSEKQISYLENGTRPISVEYASLLAQVLNVRVEYLL